MGLDTSSTTNDSLPADGSGGERKTGRWQTAMGWPKLANAGRGLRAAFEGDRSVAWKVPLLVGVLSASIYYRNWVDVLVLVVATTTLLAAELLNTAIEDLCDFVEPRFDPRIGRIKDIAAAAVMICHGGWLAVVFFEAARLVL